MLLFNRLLIKQLIKNFYFNTSHVIIQHVEVLFDQYFLLISIHPMLLFNFILLPFFHKLDIFQYILCYYSTEDLMFPTKKPDIFQYILCYYSTENIVSKSPNKAPFQYILCYYSTNEKPSFLHLTDLYKSRF